MDDPGPQGHPCNGLFYGNSLCPFIEDILVFAGNALLMVASGRQIPELYSNIHLLSLYFSGFFAVFFYVFVWEPDLKVLYLCLPGLQACVCKHAGLPERPIGHLVPPAVSR